ncbi:MAG: hypothetical protein CMJ81_10760 [Planctomycetaceae bacterium]|nr:hypothetical protein [Planctomycetaceae bacterium]
MRPGAGPRTGFFLPAGVIYYFVNEPPAVITPDASARPGTPRVSNSFQRTDLVVFLFQWWFAVLP